MTLSLTAVFGSGCLEEVEPNPLPPLKIPVPEESDPRPGDGPAAVSPIPPTSPASSASYDRTEATDPADPSDGHEPEFTFGFCPTGTGPILRDLPSCEGSDLLSHPPIPVASLDPGDELIPLGHLRPPWHTYPTDHMYWHIKDSDPNTRGVDAVPFRSLGDMTISVIGHVENLETGVIHYMMDFHPCREVMGHIAYITSLSPELRDAYDQDQAACWADGPGFRRCCLKMNVQTTAGQELGGLGGANARGIDFTLYDTRIAPLAFANPDRYRRDDNGFDRFHIVCPVDYFMKDLRTNLEDKIWRVGDVEPLCGRIDQDIPGTAQGTWFVPGTENPADEKEAIHLSYDNIHPSRSVFSIGNAAWGTARYEVWAPMATGRRNREFKDITLDGNIYCFDGMDYAGNILMQMTSETTLKIEKQPPTGFGCGDGPWSFTGAAVTLER